MKKVKSRKNEYWVLQKRSGKYAVKAASGKWILGDEKTKILINEGLLKPAPAKKKPEPAAEAPAEA